MFEEHGIQKIFVIVDIPFLLRVEDSINDNPPKYTVNIEGYNLGVDFQKMPGGTDSVDMAVQSHSDRLGRVSKTKCQVKFGPEYISEILNEIQGSPIGPDPVVAMGSGQFSADQQPRRVASDAVRAINKCLRAYRRTTEEYWLRDLFVEELLHFGIIGIDRDGQEHASEQTMTPSPMTGFGSTLPDDEHKQFVERILSDDEYNTFLELELNVREQIDVGQYELGVIDSYRIFELWVKNASEIIMDARGKSQSNIDDKLKDNGDYENLMNIIKNILKDDPDVSYDFSSKSEFDNWESTTNNLRNDIVHEGVAISRNQALDAHENTGTALGAFYSDFIGELSGTRCDVVGQLGDVSAIPTKSP